MARKRNENGCNFAAPYIRLRSAGMHCYFLLRLSQSRPYHSENPSYVNGPVYSYMYVQVIFALIPTAINDILM